MAHFAELNSSNEVLRVIVISNDDVDANGGDQHADAETFVASIVPHSTGGTAWKQTSYNNNFRKQYAGAGNIYDASKNKLNRSKAQVSQIFDWYKVDFKSGVVPFINKYISTGIALEPKAKITYLEYDWALNE